MQGVGPGSLLGGRYLLQRRTAQHSRYERWLATDQTLDRQVVLLCFDGTGPVAPPALDAARRAAGVDEPRLVRVLDVGRDGGTAFVVEESLDGAHSVTAALADGGLPSEEARRIVGEAAAALERARARGLHHGVLTPRSVFRLSDGSVKVRGLATEAALLGVDEEAPERATRGDTVALVGLTYALLTGRWPLPGPDAGLEAAPRVVGGVAAPSEIAAGVPPDLDFIARHTLSEDSGPRTPGELVEQIGPWSATPVTGGLEVGDMPEVRRVLGTRTEPLERDRRTGGLAPPPARPRPGRPAPDPAAAGHPRSVLGVGIDPATADRRTATERFEPDEGIGRDPDRAPPAAVAGAVAAGAAAGTALAKGVGSAVGAAGSLAARASERVGGLARGAADRAAERSANRAERRQTEQWEDPLERVTISEALEPTEEQLEPALPLLPGGAQEPLDRDQSRLALLLVAGLVVVAAALGLWGLPKLTSFGSGSTAAPVVTQTVTATPSTPADGGAPITPSATPTTSASLAPIAIVSASEVSANGGVQQVRSAASAFDGNGDTSWTSSKWYATPQYGGLPNRTTGLLLDLGQSVDVHQVTFTVKGPADVTVYVGDQTSVDGNASIGAVTQQDGEATVAVPGGGAAKGRYVILWFTSLGPDTQPARYRAQVSEVAVR